MPSPGYYTRNEIFTQPDAWEKILDDVKAQLDHLKSYYRPGRFDSIIMTGCGSTYYLTLAAAAQMQTFIGVPARGLPASEIWLSPQSSYIASPRTLMIAVSRSGETTETLRACEAFRAKSHGEVVTLSCYPGRALTKLGTLNLVFPGGQETSIAQTRAFSSLYLAAISLAAIWADKDDLFNEFYKLPDICRHLLTDHQSLARSIGSYLEYERFYFLGSGIRYGLACELSLKMKEMSLTHSEPFHFMEFRHGPQSMVNAQTMIVGLVSEANKTYEWTVLEEMKSRGAHILSMGESKADIVFPSGVGEVARNVLYLPIGQLLAFERALARGLNPDQPHNLDAVVKLTE
jgi:glucosamine--fructose-6-phosphate aminotransferase (isomerizing)